MPEEEENEKNDPTCDGEKNRRVQNIFIVITMHSKPIIHIADLSVSREKAPGLPQVQVNKDNINRKP